MRFDSRYPSPPAFEGEIVGGEPNEGYGRYVMWCVKHYPKTVALSVEGISYDDLKTFTGNEAAADRLLEFLLEGNTNPVYDDEADPDGLRSQF